MTTKTNTTYYLCTCMYMIVHLSMYVHAYILYICVHVQILEEYNENHKPMNLVLFDNALEHLTRIHRLTQSNSIQNNLRHMYMRKDSVLIPE